MKNNLVRIQIYCDDANLIYKLINYNIYYYNLIKNKEYYIVTVSINDYKRLSRRYECKVIRYYGKNFYINFFNIHKHIIISFIISILFLHLLTNTILDIDINTDDNNLREIIKKSLISNDIDIYKKKKSIKEIEKIKEIILKENEDTLEWIEIKEKGCKYIIDLTPRVKKEKENISDEPCDIIASKDGKIMYIVSNAGEVVKEKNDYVKKGDILISGNIMKDDKISYQVKSNGKVYAEVWYTTKVTIPFNYVEYIKTGNIINRYYLNIFGKEFTIIGKYNGNNIMKEKKLVINKPYLPFKIYKETIQRYKYNKFSISENEAYNEAIKRSDNNIQKILKDDEYIISKKVLKKEAFSSKIKIEVFYKVYENIAVASKIIKEDEEYGK